MSEIDPRTARHLIADQGEIVIDEVRKHWASLVGAVVELACGVAVAILAVIVPPAWWLFLLVAAVLIAHAIWRILDRRMDRFVITNMRVFRIHGILSQHIATMPLARILDITVDKPFVGRILGYGHFIFESAAQAQGLREIRFVGNPDGRGLTIQRVIQQAGLRGWAGRDLGAGHGTSAPMREQRRVSPAAAPAPVVWNETLQFPPLDRAPHDPAPFEPAAFEPEPFDTALFDPDATDTDPIELPR